MPANDVAKCAKRRRKNHTAQVIEIIEFAHFRCRETHTIFKALPRKWLILQGAKTGMHRAVSPGNGGHCA